MNSETCCLLPYKDTIRKKTLSNSTTLTHERFHGNENVIFKESLHAEKLITKQISVDLMVESETQEAVVVSCIATVPAELSSHKSALQ